MDTPIPKRILIADDTAAIRSLLKQLLKQQGFDVVAEAADGRQALDFFTEFQPQIVCLDIDMPLLNGLEVLARIKQDAPQTRVIMITGDNQTLSVEKAIARGASGYIIKPFNSKKVAAVINKALKKTAKEKARPQAPQSGDFN